MTQETLLTTDDSMTILYEIGSSFGRVPNLFQTYAKYPPLLAANWNKVKVILLTGKLPRLPKEIIALLVSHDNGCAYCIAAHSAALKSMGVSGNNIMRGELDEHLNDKEIALVNFARKANQLSHDIGKNDFEKLISLGYTEAEIMEALGVMELFAGFNRFAKAMKIEIDF